MLEVRDLDLEWYWLGVGVGMNSRKKLSESPDIIRNYGKQGIVKVPTDKQIASFIIGLNVGRRKIVNKDVSKLRTLTDEQVKLVEELRNGIK